MRAGSARRPSPSSPQASGPLPGSTKATPRPASRARFSVIAPEVHMRVFIAGAISTGHLTAV